MTLTPDVALTVQAAGHGHGRHRGTPMHRAQEGADDGTCQGGGRVGAGVLVRWCGAGVMM